MTDNIERTCEKCGRLSVEFDFFYGEVVEGSDCIGRLYYCRGCLGEKLWHSLAEVPEIGTGLFLGRSTRIAQRRDPSA